MTSGDDPPLERTLRQRLLALVDQARADHGEFLAATSEAERSAQGTPEQWSAKDHLAHLNFWRGVSLERLNSAERGTIPPEREDYQSLNEETFARERETPWETLVARAEDQFAAVRAHVGHLADEEWMDPKRYPWRKGEPLLTSLTGNFYEHPLEHYIQLALERGESAEAFAMQQANVRQMREFFGDGEPYANALYNLACFYVRQGEGERALDPLSEALHLRPTLIEWSKQDPDLDPLRDLPAFQELYDTEQE